MANADSPYGFKPWGPLLSAFPFTKDASAAESFINDVMMGEADGGVAPATAGSVNVIGANLTYSAGSTAATVMIANDPDQLYQAQEDGTVTGGVAGIHAVIDHIAGAGSSVTKLSGHELDSSDLNTTGGGFQLMDVVNRQDNTVAANSEWICRANLHLSAVAGGV